MHKKLLLSLVFPLFLSGCAGLSGSSWLPWGSSSEGGSGALSEEVEPPEGSEAFWRVRAQGVQVFVCAKDRNGRWWQFLRPRVTLSGGGATVAQGANFVFAARDGSRLSAQIVAARRDEEGARNLPSVRFAVQSTGKKGFLSETVWVTRTEGRGGMPLTLCSPSEVGRVQEIPFSALYTFWRPEAPRGGR